MYTARVLGTGILPSIPSEQTPAQHTEYDRAQTHLDLHTRHGAAISSQRCIARGVPRSTLFVPLVIRRVGHHYEALSFGGFWALDTKVVRVHNLRDEACRVDFGGDGREEFDAEWDIVVSEVEGGQASVGLARTGCAVVER